MTDAEVLMMDGCTRKEAERHLERGTTVFQKSDFEKNFDNYLDEWGIVEDVDGNVYFIQYCL